MKKMWSEISGIPVTLSESEGVLGKLNGAFIHPETGTIIAFLVGFSRVLVPVDIEKWGKNSITIGEAEVLVSPFDILRIEEFGFRRTYFLGKKVRSKKGYRYGTIKDFTLETTTSSLLTLEVSKGFFWVTWGKRIFSWKDISEITESAIILNCEPEEPTTFSEHSRTPQICAES